MKTTRCCLFPSWTKPQPKYDSAELCLSKSLDFAEECHSVEVKQKALNNYVKLHQFKGDYDKVIKCLSMVRPLNSQQLMLNKLNFGKVYMEMGCYFCCLYLLGLKNADVSALLQKAYPTVCERDRKIRRIIGQGNDLVTVLTTI